MAVRWQALAFLAVVGLASCSGCKSDFPPVQKWNIKVVFKGTGKPMPAGTIELENVEDPTLKGFGDVGADGIAKIITFRDRKEIEGAVAGEHRVRIEAPRDVGIKLPAKYRNFETSGLKIKIPAANNPVILEIEGGGP